MLARISQYGGSSNDPSHMPTRDTVRIAAVSDMHYGKQSQGMLQSLFSQIAERADVLVLPGDLTDYGLAGGGARARARPHGLREDPDRGRAGKPRLRVGPAEEVARILTDAGVHVLDGDSVEIQGVGFAGVKGFAGGFGRGALGPWGERAIKVFVQEAVNEALKLESALARLKTAHRIAICTTRRSSARSRASPSRSIPGSARAGWRSRSCATR